MAQQTAVEWLIEKIAEDYPEIPRAYREEYQKAKAMEKEQVIKNMIELLQWMNKVASETPMRLETDLDDIVEQYYNETYNK
jgi:hypothetical protein